MRVESSGRHGYKIFQPVQPFWASEATPDELNSALEAAFLPTDHVVGYYNVVLIDTGKEVLLCDAGFGKLLPATAGRFGLISLSPALAIFERKIKGLNGCRNRGGKCSERVRSIKKMNALSVIFPYRLPEGVQQRLTELLDKQDQGTPLTDAERLEAEGLVDLAELLSLLRMRSERADSQRA